MGEFPTVITGGCVAGTMDTAGRLALLGMASVVPPAMTWDGLMTTGWFPIVVVTGGDPGTGFKVWLLMITLLEETTTGILPIVNVVGAG